MKLKQMKKMVCLLCDLYDSLDENLYMKYCAAYNHDNTVLIVLVLR